MKTRDEYFLALRPEIPSIKITEAMSDEERFQNNTLRPIIKFQNDIMVQVFKNYIFKHKNVFHTLTLEKRLDYIENAAQKDMKFRNSLKGMIIGLFTLNEYIAYQKNLSVVNKRLMKLVVQRLQSNTQLFDNGLSL